MESLAETLHNLEQDYIWTGSIETYHQIMQLKGQQGIVEQTKLEKDNNGKED